jgi:NAD-dependent dihydropyrimidine dehydrogenase PreA subunit
MFFNLFFHVLVFCDLPHAVLNPNTLSHPLVQPKFCFVAIKIHFFMQSLVIALMMEAVSTSETLIKIYYTIRNSSSENKSSSAVTSFTCQQETNYFNKVKKGKAFPDDWETAILCPICEERGKQGQPG